MNVVSSESSYKFTGRTPHTHAYLGSVIPALCRKRRAKHVLDIGCGNGALIKSLVDLDCELLAGCDPSASGIEHARKAVPTAKLYQLGVYDDPQRIEETDFDVAVSTEVIEHLFYPRALPRFAHAKLRSSGYLILSTPYHGYLKNLVLSAFDKWDSHHTPFWDGGHIKFWSRRTLTKLLEEEGFKFEEFVGCGRVPYLWMSMVIVARKI